MENKKKVKRRENTPNKVRKTWKLVKDQKNKRRKQMQDLKIFLHL